MKKRQVSLCACVALLCATPASLYAGDLALEVGPGNTVVQPRVPDPPCDGTLHLNTDGDFENGYAFGFMGNQPPDFGGFAEAFTAQGEVCGMRAYLTTLPNYYEDDTADAYVYTSDGANPDVVLSVTPGIFVAEPGIWPEITIYDIPLVATPVAGEFFVYFWGAFQVGPSWFVCADVHGPVAGKPRTKIVPGIGYPTGWQDVALVWGPTDAMGIGAWVADNPVPERPVSWGDVKRLYRR